MKNLLDYFSNQAQFVAPRIRHITHRLGAMNRTPTLSLFTFECNRWSSYAGVEGAIIHQVHHCAPSLTFHLFLLKSFTLALDTIEQLMEGVGKFLHAFIQKLLGHLVIVDAKLFKSSEYGVCLGNIVLDGEAYPPVVTEVLDGFQGHGVHSVRADEFFGIQDIAIGWVLGAGAGPERSLDMRSSLLKLLEAW